MVSNDSGTHAPCTRVGFRRVEACCNANFVEHAQHLPITVFAWFENHVALSLLSPCHIDASTNVIHDSSTPPCNYTYDRFVAYAPLLAVFHRVSCVRFPLIYPGTPAPVGSEESRSTGNRRGGDDKQRPHTKAHVQEYKWSILTLGDSLFNTIMD